MRYFISLFLCLIVAYSTNSVSADLALGMQTCKKISQNKLRLTCYDDLVNINKPTSNVSLDTSSKKSAVALVITKTQQQKEDAFGKEHLKKTAEEEEKNKAIELTISGLKKMIRGEWTITFNNGQRWLQVDSTKFKLKVGDIVELKKGFFNTVYLHKKNINKNIKVKRIK